MTFPKFWLLWNEINRFLVNELGNYSQTNHIVRLLILKFERHTFVFLVNANDSQHQWRVGSKVANTINERSVRFWLVYPIPQWKFNLANDPRGRMTNCVKANPSKTTETFDQWAFMMMPTLFHLRQILLIYFICFPLIAIDQHNYFLFVT